MLCCSNCFNDNFLSAIIEGKSHSKGECDFCHTSDTSLINTEILSAYIEPLLERYELSNEEGSLISSLLKNDWNLFQQLNDETTLKLLEDILQENMSGLYIPTKQENETKILNWKEFKEELKHVNRFFPQKSPDYEHLQTLLNYIILPQNEVPELFYRARINIDIDSINKKDMGKPPVKIASAGRANPLGISYLYTASNKETAIAEIRPHKKDSITVASFQSSEKLIFADLRNPRKIISPFKLPEGGIADLEFLTHLGDELSKPILPREAHLKYLSSQYLCELIKHCGFDGVIYKSSVGDGDNYAIFFDDKLNAIETEVYIVENIQITSSRIEL
ncbi:MAG: RES domain-containing protein [Sulfurimonas sp.]|uniref:RES domain-containing protein n=1 Tax=Sulfurimonas sp. TaxID=2022749 RepID=UPI00261CB5C1|nr:RES domain-containing protein [Sulfurimonas sp.]MDD5400803.1 RES domain-containing protein [Sulfurimonas sp.]